MASVEEEFRVELMARARVLEERGIFLGGPYRKFASAGERQLGILVEHGLTDSSRVLDVGCGCLRAGVWLTAFLDPGCYFGIEPNVEMLDAGREVVLTADLERVKQPRFDTNDRFDFEVFETAFDFFLARSIWTHATRDQVRTMLEQFSSTAADGGRFLTSVIHAPWYRRASDGDAWVGKSHESTEAGIVRYKLNWIRAECASRGLVVTELGKELDQVWLCIERRDR